MRPIERMNYDDSNVCQQKAPEDAAPYPHLLRKILSFCTPLQKKWWLPDKNGVFVAQQRDKGGFSGKLTGG